MKGIYNDKSNNNLALNMPTPMPHTQPPLFNYVIDGYPNGFSNVEIVCWWSGGVPSALTAKICADIWGVHNCRFIFIGTDNEDDDTYRFKKDCEEWYGKEIETISAIGHEYDSIEDVWEKHLSLNVANGAVCSTALKRRVREKWEKTNTWSHQAFGFSIDEAARAYAFRANNPRCNPIFPLLLFGYTKKQVMEHFQRVGIPIPAMYRRGFENNNCWKTGCVQGGIGYWQKMAREYPAKFDKMAAREHRLTDLKGKPVTMLRDRTKETLAANNGKPAPLFLKPHPAYPHIKYIAMMKGRPPKPLFECNGFCGSNDLARNPTEDEINYETS